LKFDEEPVADDYAEEHADEFEGFRFRTRLTRGMGLRGRDIRTGR